MEIIYKGRSFKMSDLSLVIKPINIAKGLPNEHYIRDTILPLDILEKLKSIPRKEALASVSSTTVETASAGQRGAA